MLFRNCMLLTGWLAREPLLGVYTIPPILLKKNLFRIHQIAKALVCIRQLAGDRSGSGCEVVPASGRRERRPEAPGGRQGPAAAEPRADRRRPPEAAATRKLIGVRPRALAPAKRAAVAQSLRLQRCFCMICATSRTLPECPGCVGFRRIMRVM